MGSNRWFKSPDVLVLREKTGGGLKLIHQVTKQVQILNARQSAFWTTWEDDLIEANGWSDTHASLVRGKFILRNYTCNLSTNGIVLDSLIPSIEGNHVKWYAESPDLFVLFHTQSMPKNNPLLVLGPYGSLCWQGVVEGWSIGQIRAKALRIFGHDEVLCFLKRLINLRFLTQISVLDQIHLPPEQFTKEFRAPDIQFQLIHSAIPWYCLWEICTICDLCCKTCYLPHFHSSGPDTGDALKIAQQIIDAGIFYVSIIGGEPLLRSDLERIIEHMRLNGVFVKVISDGQNLTLERAKTLASAGLNQIEISFDGLRTETHESSRGEGTYKQTCEAIYHAQKANIPRIGMVLTVHTGNFKELPTLPNFMCESGVHECYISLFKKTGMLGASAPFNPIDAIAIQKIHQLLLSWKDIFPQLTIALLSDCSCGRTSIVIGDNGDVRLCPFLYQSIGNIYQTPLLEIWHSIKTSVLAEGPLGYCAINYTR